MARTSSLEKATVHWSRYNVSVRRSDDLLLFNTRTGSLIRLDKTRQRQLEQFEIPAEFRDFLLGQGFLVPRDLDELELIGRGYEAAQESTESLYVTIELTRACNFRCLYCYQGHVAESMDSIVEARLLRYLARRMADVRHLQVNWFGGEPLLRLRRLEKLALPIAAEAKRQGCALSQGITTNGYLLTHDAARKLKDLGVSSVQITLDGSESSHNQLRPHKSGRGTYDRVLAGCEHTVTAGLSLLLRVNLNKWSAGGVDRLLRDLLDRGITPENTLVHVTRMVDHGNCATPVTASIYGVREFAQEWIKILEIVLKHGFNLPSLAPIPYNCPFDLQQAVMIAADGTLLHCSSSSGQIGEISDDGQETNRTPLYDVVKNRRPLDDHSCRECLYLPLCMGGCAYLEGLGQEKCMPERYVVPELITLAASQAEQYSERR